MRHSGDERSGALLEKRPRHFENAGQGELTKTAHPSRSELVDARISVALKMQTSSSSTKLAISRYCAPGRFHEFGLLRTSAAQANRHAYGIAGSEVKKPQVA
jgi:hypothetical protein